MLKDIKKKNIKAGEALHAGDGGYGVGTKENYNEFVKVRNESLNLEQKERKPLTIKQIIQKLHTTLIDARIQESHFESWLTQNEGICDAIDMLKELAKQSTEWRGLTDDDKQAFVNQDFGGSRLDAMDYAEKVLKEKNHANTK